MDNVVMTLKVAKRRKYTRLEQPILLDLGMCVFRACNKSWFGCLMVWLIRRNNVQVRIARIFNTYGPRMCIDDGRVVSNFVAQVKCGSVVYLWLTSNCVVVVYLTVVVVVVVVGFEEGAANCLWWWKADKKLPVCFWSGNDFHHLFLWFNLCVILVVY